MMTKLILLVLLLLTITSLASAQPPFVTLVDNQPTAGTIFTANLAPRGAAPLVSELVALDEHGHVTRHQAVARSGYEILDVQLQPNGKLTYGCAVDPSKGIDGTGRFYVLDSSTWEITDSLFSTAPYKTDVHELRMFPNGGYMLLGASDTLMARKDWRPGSTDTTRVHIIGNTIEGFDVNKKRIFLWRGIDHYGIADADTTLKQVKFSDTNIDFQHANSIDFDANGNILLSNRHLCEVSLIDRTTGNFIWRLGGRHNEFKLLDDSVWFSYQHCARFLPNGHLLLYDNGNLDTVDNTGAKRWSSRAVEYELDVSAKTARVVWEYQHTPHVQYLAMGSVERLPNGNTVIGWGFTLTSDSVTMTEVRPDKSIVSELAISSKPSPDFCYRMLKAVPQEMSVTTAMKEGHRVRIEYGSSGHITIQIPDEQAQISICDLLGRRVFTGNMMRLMNVDVTNLPRGTYFCHVQAKDWHDVVSFVN